MLVLSRKANQLATGLVVLFLGLGLTSLFGAAYVRESINAFHPIAIPGLSSIPWLGEIFFDHDPLTYLSYVVGPAMWWLLYRSRWGLLVRAAGERDEVLAAYGHSPLRVQYLAVCGGGALAGIGGAQLATAYTNAWFENMTAGPGLHRRGPGDLRRLAPAQVRRRGLPVRRRPGPLAGAAGPGLGINQFALDALPYVVTVLVLIFLGRKRLARRARGPAEGLRDGAHLADPQPDQSDPRRNHARRASHDQTMAAGSGDASPRLAPRDARRAAATAPRTDDHRRRGRRTAGGAPRPGTGGKAVGFIFVGPKDDFGYNQAAYDGSQAVDKAFPDLKVLTAENVPEDDNATRVMEDMISKGAKIIFATSYGHLDPAAEGRRRPPRRGRRSSRATSINGHGRRPTSAPTSAPCTSPSTWPASPPGRPPRPTSSATSTPSRSPRRIDEHQRLPARRASR